MQKCVRKKLLSGVARYSSEIEIVQKLLIINQLFLVQPKIILRPFTPFSKGIKPCISFCCSKVWNFRNFTRFQVFFWKSFIFCLRTISCFHLMRMNEIVERSLGEVTDGRQRDYICNLVHCFRNSVHECHWKYCTYLVHLQSWHEPS